MKNIAKILFIWLAALLVAACSCSNVERYKPRVERPEKPTRLNYVKYGPTFNDMNDTHLAAAQAMGIEPLATRADVENASRELVYIESCPAYDVEPLTHSSPLLVPEAAALLKDIGENFQDSLVRHHYSPYKIIVTSVLRTDEDVKGLSRRNINASKRSVHCYGTTVDVTYKRFQRLDDDEAETSQAKLKAVLGEVLRDLKAQGRCYVKHEVKQACFHITVRK